MSTPLATVAPLLAFLLLAAGTPTAPTPRPAAPKGAKASPSKTASPRPTSTPARPARTTLPAEPSTPSAPSRPLVMEVNSVSPDLVRVGKNVTITGSGLLQVKAILFGGYAPFVLEQSDTKIVFKVPADPNHPDGYQAVPFFLIPGYPVQRGGGSVTVRPYAMEVDLPSARRPDTILAEETFEVTSAASKRLEVAVPAEASISIEATTAEGSDVTVQVDPLDPPGPGTLRVSSAGQLRWRVSGRDLYGSRPAQKHARKVAVTISSEASLPVRVKLSVRADQTGSEKATPVPAPR